ncbi:MAG: YdcH family protein [Rhodospirillales bacterium]|nr:YdcH family protein [Rhodospirillales bacterium]MCB9995479.1 YdcH family protein [Rhodospirillales bacterium]
MEDEEELLQERLYDLETEHRDLDQVIDRLMHTPPIDFLQLQRLKKRKLQLKDEIERIRSMLLPDIIA